jgi:hypothetical protein
MAERIKLPSEPTGRPEDQLRQLYNYLYEMARTLNININEYGDAALTDEEQQLMNQLNMDKTTSQTDETVPPGHNYQEQQTLKSLIIKTADFVKTQIDNYRIVLFGETEASGDFGQYRQKKGVKVDVTPDGVKQTFSFAEVVKGTKTFEINSKNYIKTGYLRTENSLPVYGVAIGKDIVTFSEDGTETYNDGSKVAELTSDALSFFQNGVLLAKYAGTKTSFYSGGEEVMYIQNGKIYAAKDLIISAGQKIQLGNWEFNEDAITLKSGDSYYSYFKIINLPTIHGIVDADRDTVGLAYGDDYMGLSLYKFVKDDNVIFGIPIQFNDPISSGGYTVPAEVNLGEFNHPLSTFTLQPTKLKIAATSIIPQYSDITSGEDTTIGRTLYPFHDGYFTNLNCTNLYYNNSYQASSREIKHDIQDMESKGEQLDRLRPVTFIYDADPKERRRYGLIYEEAIEHMPEICTGEETNKAINYMELVPMLLKEIQDLRARVAELERRN